MTRHVKGLPHGNDPGKGCGGPTLGHVPFSELIIMAREMASPLTARRMTFCGGLGCGFPHISQGERTVLSTNVGKRGAGRRNTVTAPGTGYSTPKAAPYSHRALGTREAVFTAIPRKTHQGFPRTRASPGLQSPGPAFRDPSLPPP